jgi:hypothetical protein
MFVPTPKPVNTSMIDGKGAPKMSSTELSQNLSRMEWWSMDMFFIISSLITPYSIEVAETEKGVKNMDNEQKIKENINREQGILTKSKTCFSVGLQVPGGVEAAKLKNWVFKVKTSDNKLYELFYMPSERYPDEPKVSPSQAYAWLNGGYVCSKDLIPIKNNFEFHAIPQLIHGDLGAARVLRWEVIGETKKSASN